MNIILSNNGAYNENSAFGTALANLRNEKGISQSRFVFLGKINLSDLRKIEKGLIQPSIKVAMRLITALNADSGVFFSEFAKHIEPKHLEIPDKNVIAKSDISIKLSLESATAKFLANLEISTLDEKSAEVKSVFGLFFAMVRHSLKEEQKITISQKVIAENAKYNLRNLLGVEKGKQDPSVLNATKMIKIITRNSDMDIELFFSILQNLMQDTRIIKPY